MGSNTATTAGTKELAPHKLPHVHTKITCELNAKNWVLLSQQTYCKERNHSYA
jgi:hypothetical protein